jgi:serine/threonine protein kinase/formylglycine-generating enzyme required for sulfatase activity
MPTYTELPAQFGRYRIEKKLGEGGMGAVYLAEDAKLHRKVALKVPKLASAEDIQRFQREARVAAAIDHAHVCPVLDIGCVDGIHYLTMPFIDGVPLTKLIDRSRPLPVPRAVGLVHQLAVTLQAMHGRGLMHRDLKPANIMLKHGQEPILMDFGLARGYGEHATRLTGTGAMMGTPGYMPPEQINGDVQAMGPGSDVYSLGVILYELLTGRLPYEGDSVQALFFKVFSQPPPLPSAVRPELDPALDAICTKAMAKKPAERFASMAELAEVLDRVLASPVASAPGEKHGARTRPRSPTVDDDVRPTLPKGLPVAPKETEVFRLACPRCGQKLRAPTASAGKAARCPKCRTQIPVPGEPAPASPVRPDPALTSTPPPRDSDTIPSSRPQPMVGVLVAVSAVVLAVGLLLGWLLFGRGKDGTSLASNSSTSKTLPTEDRGRQDNPIPKVEPKPPGKEKERPSVPMAPPEAEKKAAAAPPKAEPKPPPEAVDRFTNSLGIRFVRVPKGSCWMGSPADETGRNNDEAQKEVTIPRDFHLGVFEVTQGQWEAVMGNNPSLFSRTGQCKAAVQGIPDAELKEFPVEAVSWNDIQEFLKKLNELDKKRPSGWVYRLPREAEWEYACRGGPLSSRQEGRKTAPFYFAKPTFSLSSQQANFQGNSPYGGAAKGPSRQRTTKVGSYEANALGICDLHGNVWEWCEDSCAGGSDRVYRGGCWGNGGPRCRAACRGGFAPAYGSGALGFRLALVPSGL